MVSEADLLHLGGVARSTWRNWTKQPLLDASKTATYGEGDVAELVIVSRLIEALDTRRAELAWLPAREDVMELVWSTTKTSEFDLVVDVQTLKLTVATDAESLTRAVHARVPTPRPFLVLSLAELLIEARDGFWARAVPSTMLAEDKRRKAHRSAKPSASSG